MTNGETETRNEKIERLKQYLGRRTIELLEKLDPDADVYVAYLYPGAGILLDGYAMSANQEDYFGATLGRLYDLLKDNEIKAYSLQEKEWLDKIDEVIEELAREDGVAVPEIATENWYKYRDSAVERLDSYLEVENGALYVYQMNGEYFEYDAFMEAVNSVFNDGVEINSYDGYIAPCGIQKEILGYKKYYEE